jgi:hypothetical protein
MQYQHAPYYESFINLPTVNVIQNDIRLRLTMSIYQVFCNPTNEMIFEGSFDYLVKQVRSNKLMNIRAREIICEWLITEMIRFVGATRTEMKWDMHVG